MDEKNRGDRSISQKDTPRLESAISLVRNMQYKAWMSKWSAALPRHRQNPSRIGVHAPGSCHHATHTRLLRTFHIRPAQGTIVVKSEESVDFRREMLYFVRLRRYAIHELSLSSSAFHPDCRMETLACVASSISRLEIGLAANEPTFCTGTGRSIRELAAQAELF